MLGPSSQHQQYPQYHGHPPSQAQYPSSGIQHDGRSQQPQQTNGHSHGADMNNPYQQYGPNYGQSPQYPHGQGQPQQIPQQQAQYPAQHQQQQPQQQPPQQATQQQQVPQAQRSYMPGQNQLPPLGPPMSSSNMVPAVTESQSSQAASPANPPQPPPYMPAAPQAMQQQPLAPPAPRASVSAASTNAKGERRMESSSERGQYRFSLEVVQQPQRARMCGFGDKDRRPITPPPCVRLVIVDINTGREVSVNEIESDPSFFLLQCDLWAESADREANVVRASSNSPAVSISSATTTSYPPPAETPARHLAHEQHGVYMNEAGQPVYSTLPGYAMNVNGRPTMMSSYPMPGYPANGGMYYPQQVGQQMQYMAPQQNNAMYTRNLIGSLTVNAAKLSDDNGKPGYWFVLQDLSVRTEGFFRLRMSFVDISNPSAPGVIKGATPVLAWTFSNPFQVYSAKKFPGVIESTPLSKAFAGQGIKIPIRKDNKNDAPDDDDGD